MINIAGFILCGIIIFFAGRKLSYYGNLLAELTGLGKAWLGLILMASITSLPELMVGFSSSAIVQSADLAVGDVFGSCAFNLGILAMMDAVVPGHKPLLGQASSNHILAIGMGIILMALAGVGLYLPDEIVITSGLGLTSVLFIAIYFFSIWLIYKFGTRSKQLPSAGRKYGTKPPPSLKKVILMFILFSLVIVISALFLPYFTQKIAAATGLDTTFAGTLLLAVSTSLPEIAVSIAAVRIGAIDLAVGNLVGSNLFNILILAVDDIFYVKGHLLKDASDTNLISCMATIIMSAIAIIGLSYRLETKRLWLAWDALLIFGIYIINILILYQLTKPTL